MDGRVLCFFLYWQSPSQDAMNQQEGNTGNPTIRAWGSGSIRTFVLCRCGQMLSWFPILRTMFISIKLLDVNLTKQGILLYRVWVCWSKSCAIQPQSTCRGFTSSQGQLAERWFFRFGCYSWKREMWPDQNKLALAKYSSFSKSRRCRKEKHHISWMLNCFLKIYFEIIGWYDNTIYIYYALFFL